MAKPDKFKPVSIKFANEIGKSYGRLTLLKFMNDDVSKSRVNVLCLCTCGNLTEVKLAYILNGDSKSCGCLMREKVSEINRSPHGLVSHPPNGVWKSIKNRCFNKNVKNYHRYGGRGIIVCEEWREDFMSFYNWAIENGYEKGKSIDRIDNDGPYSPDNCKFSTPKEQARNTSATLFVEVFPGERITLREAVEKYSSVPYATVWDRLKKFNWDLQEAIFVPRNGNRAKNRSKNK